MSFPTPTHWAALRMLTRDRWEVDADQHGEVSGDVTEHIGQSTGSAILGHGHGHGGYSLLFHKCSLVCVHAP